MITANYNYQLQLGIDDVEKLKVHIVLTCFISPSLHLVPPLSQLIDVLLWENPHGGPRIQWPQDYSSRPDYKWERRPYQQRQPAADNADKQPGAPPKFQGVVFSSVNGSKGDNPNKLPPQNGNE